MVKYEKVIVNGQELYREFCTSTGYYTDVLSKEELIDTLLAQSVQSVTEIHEQEIEQALDTMDPYHKNIVETYINYLERVVESLERSQRLENVQVFT